MIVKPRLGPIRNRIVTAGGNSEPLRWDTSQFNHLIIYTRVDTFSGTTPTIAVNLEELVTPPDIFGAITVLVPSTGSATTTKTIIERVGDSCRIFWTVGGTTPSIRLNVDIIGVREL